MARKLYTISIFCCTRLNGNGAGWRVEPACNSRLRRGAVLTQATAQTRRIASHRTLCARRVRQAEPAFKRACGAGLSLRKQQPKQGASLPIEPPAANRAAHDCGFNPPCTLFRACGAGFSNRKNPVHYKKRTASHRTLCARRVRQAGGLNPLSSAPSARGCPKKSPRIIKCIASHRIFRANRARHKRGLAG